MSKQSDPVQQQIAQRLQDALDDNANSALQVEAVAKIVAELREGTFAAEQPPMAASMSGVGGAAGPAPGAAQVLPPGAEAEHDAHATSDG
jgi:hypothetical protein